MIADPQFAKSQTRNIINGPMDYKPWVE